MSLSKLDSEIFIRVSHTSEVIKSDVNYESGYERWRKKNPPLECEMSVNPQGNLFLLWTFLISFAVTYNLFIVPGYVYIAGENVKIFWEVVNLMSDFLYLSDIFVQSRLRFIEDGCERFEPAATRAHYYRSLFFLDGISVFPFEIFHGILPYPFNRGNRIIKVYRVLDLFSMAERRLKQVVVSTARIVFLCTVIFHWNACIYFLMGQFQNTSLKASLNSTFDDDTENGWPYIPAKITDFYIANGQYNCQTLYLDEQREHALVELYKEWHNRTIRYEFSQSVKEYVQSFFWGFMTITTLGEQPSPDETYQTVFETIDTLVGVLVFASIMGSVGALVGNANRIVTNRRQLNDGLKQFMDFRKADEETRKRVLRHCVEKVGEMHDREVRGSLPDHVYLAVNRYTALFPLTQNHFFRGTGAAFLADIARHLVSHQFSTGDVISRIGEEQMEMYIVARGRLTIEYPDGSCEELKEGRTIGEEGLMTVSYWKGTVYSREYSQIYVLSQDKFFKVLEDYPDLEEPLQIKITGKRKSMIKTRNTLEEMMKIHEQIEELEEKLDGQYSHFVKTSLRLKQRVFHLEQGTLKLYSYLQ